jgi:hypothetical protein
MSTKMLCTYLFMTVIPAGLLISPSAVADAGFRCYPTPLGQIVCPTDPTETDYPSTTQRCVATSIGSRCEDVVIPPAPAPKGQPPVSIPTGSVPAPPAGPRLPRQSGPGSIFGQ